MIYMISWAFLNIGGKKQPPKYVDIKEGFCSYNYPIDKLLRTTYTSYISEITAYKHKIILRFLREVNF